MKFITGLLFTFLISLSHYALSEVISKIEIGGISSTTRGTVLSYLPIEVGDEFNDSLSDLSIKKLYDSGLFDDIKISFVEGVLKVIVTEKPVISYFEVKGFKNDRVINEEALKRTLQDLKLTSGDILNKNTLDKFMKSLELEYKQSGHYKANIELKVNNDSQNRVGVTVNIDEGNVARINSFKIEGGNSYKEDYLLNFFEIGEPDFFLINFFTEKDFFSQLEFDAGIQKIKSHYLSEGYLDFEIKNQVVEISENKEDINIKIEIFEGDIYSIAKIDFKGDYLNLTKQNLNTLLDVKVGDIFKRSKLIIGLENINNFFGDQGFAFATIDANTNQNSKNKDVDLIIEANVNKRIYLNRITITGNTRTQDDVIRREINLLEGQQYSKSELDKSIKNIKRLAFFKSVDMKTIKVPGSIDKVDLLFVVDENKTGELSIGLSQSNSTGAAFTFGIRERNFLGTGNILNASLITSEAVEELTFFFQNPDFNGKKHTLGYGAFSRSTDSRYIDLSSYTLNEIGVNASYGIPISEYAKFTNGFKFADVDLACGSVYTYYESAQCTTPSSQLDITYFSSVNENSLNDSTFPSDGRKNNLKLEVGLPFADLNYYKFDASHVSYYPIKNNLVFKFNSSVGLIDSYKKSTTPFYKKYFGGGTNSIRGFDLNSLGPKYENNSVKGGEVSLLSSASLISPVPLLEDSKNMRVGAFVDAGSITENLTDFDLNDIRASTGVGFSWVTPIGPIGVSWSKPLIYKATDDTETFTFNLGATF